LEGSHSEVSGILNNHIKEILDSIPDQTGVYLMKDSDGMILYIGKAKSLRSRVRSYFQNDSHSPKIEVMIPKIHSVDFITTDNEVEALLLEDTLVKKHQPRYNTLLKDDKKFPWIEITDDKYPRIIVTRNPSKKSRQNKSKYYGPYVNAGALYATIDFLKQVFPLKQCKTPVYRDKPCMNYHIHRCLGPCQELVTPEEYQQVLKQVELFLSGRQNELIKKLEEMMSTASKNLEYEKAAKYRDTISSIDQVIKAQKIIFDDHTIEQDIFSFLNDETGVSIVLLKIREGKLAYKESFNLTFNELDTAKETFLAFMENYYRTVQGDQLPKEIIVPCLAEETVLLEQLLYKKKGSKVRIILPKAGKKFDLLQMAEANARIALSNFQQQRIREYQNAWNQVGVTIQDKLNLPHFPLRLECFDISHLAGTDTVASMVVFLEGKPLKSDYRKFKIRSTEGKVNDYEAMKEVIKRRYLKLKKDNKSLPDLIIIDGGKGQLSFAINALKEIGLNNQPVISLAKRLEEVFIPGCKAPVIFDIDSPVLYLFQQIRDEAHRFAVTFQRNLRSKRMVKSRLDSIKFVGKQRKAFLLKHFGTLENILSATVEDIAEVKGISYNLARIIHRELHKK
jgi:excinuclease ABC subunit C